MKKRLLYLLVLVAILTACSSNNSTETDTEKETKVETQMETEAETMAETQMETEAETMPETQPETEAETMPETQVESETNEEDNKFTFKNIRFDMPENVTVEENTISDISGSLVIVPKIENVDASFLISQQFMNMTYEEFKANEDELWTEFVINGGGDGNYTKVINNGVEYITFSPAFGDVYATVTEQDLLYMIGINNQSQNAEIKEMGDKLFKSLEIVEE